jgi:hypothetical protein
MAANLFRSGFLASLTLLFALFAVAATGAEPASAKGPGLAQAIVAPGGGKGKVALMGKRRVGAAGPAAPKAAAPNRAGLLFDGSRIAAFDLQAAPGAISEVADPAGSGQASFRMSVDDDDVAPITPTDNPRAQALSPPIIHPGDEFWLQTKFMIPAGMPEVDGWMSLVSIYGAPFRGSSPWQIEVSGDRIQWMRNDTYDYDVPWSMPLTEGRWVNVLLHERFASDGWVEMWIDGQQVSFAGGQKRLDMATMDSSNNGGANSAKIMQYREAGMFESASVFFGPLMVGTTRESVAY